MYQRFLRTLSLLLVAVLFLSSCGSEKSDDNAGSNHWSEWPGVTYGTIASEALKEEAWNCGRLEATSDHYMAETQDGYYLLDQDHLYFADKDNLNTWLRVCNEPNCSHIGPECKATIKQFVIQNNRIFYAETANLYPELSGTKRIGLAIFSKALDGTDIRLEYLNEDMLFSAELGGSSFSILTGEHWVYYSVELTKDGSYALKLFRTTKDSSEILVNQCVEDYQQNSMFSMERLMSMIVGDVGFNHLLLGDSPYMECRYKDGELYYTDLSAHYEDGRYLSTNLLRCYRMNDGYYDVNLETGEEVRIGDAYLKNSECIIALPNCIIETSLFIYGKQPESGAHTMAIFDGESWQEVMLPNDLLQTDYQCFLTYRGIAADGSIFFTAQDLRGKRHIYRLDLNQEELVLEYCAQLGG